MILANMGRPKKDVTLEFSWARKTTDLDRVFCYLCQYEVSGKGYNLRRHAEYIMHIKKLECPCQQKVNNDQMINSLQYEKLVDDNGNLENFENKMLFSDSDSCDVSNALLQNKDSKTDASNVVKKNCYDSSRQQCNSTEYNEIKNDEIIQQQSSCANPIEISNKITDSVQTLAYQEEYKKYIAICTTDQIKVTCTACNKLLVNNKFVIERHLFRNQMHIDITDGTFAIIAGKEIQYTGAQCAENISFLQGEKMFNFWKEN